MRRWTMAVALIAVGVLGFTVAGCGGGGKRSSSPATTEATTTTQATTTQATTTATTPTVAPTTTPTTSGTPSFASSGNCRDLATSAQKFSSALTGAAGDLKKQADIFQQFANQAPSDIRSDVKTIADAFSKLANAGVTFKSGQVPNASDLAKLQAAVKQINQAKVRTASAHIEAWVKKNCTG